VPPAAADPAGSATVVLVDVANVVGSRPDGWWRDRAGATGRLLSRLATLPGTTTTGPDGAPLHVTALVAVVEGQARAVAGPVGVQLVRAAGSGDDALAETAAALADRDGELLVVTADRGLRARLPRTARLAGPRWLLDAVERPTACG
jgi:hypothetical protein